MNLEFSGTETRVLGVGHIDESSEQVAIPARCVVEELDGRNVCRLL